MAADDLTPKQRLFINAYVGTARFNGAEAARQAGYSDAESSAKHCLKLPAIRARIAEELEARALTKEAVLAELSEVALSEWKHHIQVKLDADGSVIDAKLDLGDKVKALELIGKYHRLFVDKVEHSGKLTFADLLNVADPGSGEGGPQEGG